MIAQFLDHLWQSTVILCLVGLLTLLLRKNSAGARYWLWFAASVKFLVPLSLLTSLTSLLLPLPVAPVLSAPTSELAQRVAQPFVEGPSLPSASALGAPAVPAVDFSTALLIIWSVGFGAVLLSWFIRWRRIRRTVYAARPLSLEMAIPLRESPTLMEPGLVGIWNPVILLPEGLAQRLTAAEVRGILAHELCHYRRRDNFTFAVHMLVEALFWFYPPIWWLGARLTDERERACDEAVLTDGNDAEVYAESILKVCRYFSQSAIACVAGVSGGALSRRVEQIMSGRNALPVGRAKKLFLTISIAGALFAMVLFGGLSGPAAQAQASTSAVPTPAESAKLLAEQTRPQKEVPFKSADFDKFVGYYKDETSDLYARVYRDGDHYYLQLTAQPPAEFFPESPTEFFATVVAAQISFVTGPHSRVTGMIIHQNGFLRPWARISQSEYEAAAAKLQRRIKDNVPSPGTEASLRRWIRSLQEGHPNYSEMGPGLAAAARAQAPIIERNMNELGALRSLAFVRTAPDGWDIYEGTFANGQAVFNIAPLAPDGKVVGRFWRVLP